MHFLIDASLPRAAATLLRELGHEATDVRDAGMGDAADDTIAAYARRNRLVLITRDFDFADIRNYPPSLYEGILVLKLREHATAALVVRILQAFVRRDDWIMDLKTRLAILEDWRVRFRSE
jgi:predicted nuclease of predicted toxin-antitoxin system